MKLILIILASFHFGWILSSEQDMIPMETFDNFKTLMMYFNEPMLNKASLKEFSFIGNGHHPVSFDGFESFEMAKALKETIKSIKGRVTKETAEFERVLNTKEWIKHMYNTYYLGEKENMAHDTNGVYESFQNFVKSTINANGILIVPSGWAGYDPHGIGLILKKSSVISGENDEPKYDLTVVNSGDGLQFHQSREDPNGIYPWLSRLWIEFKGIPESEIFSSNFWFLRALSLIQCHRTSRKIESFAGSGTLYFYGSILPNFRKYLAEPNPSDIEKFVPEQRSGSCSLSSLLGCLLYMSENELNYNRDRVIIGHAMLRNFLERYEYDSGFLKIITDGFESFPRKAFSATSSSLAQQLSLYLEKKYPSVFMNSGLLGKGRLTWAREKLPDAVNILANDEESLKLIKDTIELALTVQDILKSNIVDKERTKIMPFDQNRRPNLKDFQLPAYQLKSSSSKNPNSLLSFLDKNPDRTILSITDLKSLNSNLAVHHLSDLKIFTKVLDVFRSTQNREWWTYFNDPGLEITDLIEFMDKTSYIISRYMNSTKRPDNLEDIVMLAHLQIGVWKCAITYDNMIENESMRLGLNNFKPPQVVENTRYDGKLAKKNWNILTSFSPNNIDELTYLSGIYNSLSTGNEEFPGPIDFFDAAKKRVESMQVVYNRLINHKLKKVTTKMFETMFNNSEIRKIIDEIKSNSNECRNIYADLTILLTYQNRFVNIFPHFFYIINNSISMFIRAGQNAFEDKNPSPAIFKSTWTDPKNIELSYKKPVNGFGFYPAGLKSYFNCDLIGYPFEICAFNQNPNENIFYALRHSSSKTPYSGMFDIWFNYIIGANDATIFDNPYFLYLSDRIINMPVVQIDLPSSNANRAIENRYFVDFTNDHVEMIYKEFLRLINLDLNIVVKKHADYELKQRHFHLRRAVNLGIIIVRFLGRTDYDKIVSADLSAKLLAEIYQKFFEFAPLKTPYNLESELSSIVNIILTQICDLSMRNPQTFIDKLSISIPNLTRSNLARVHGFLSKISYSFSSTQLGKSQIDDLVNYGFIFRPVCQNDIPVMNDLLKLLFLPEYTSNVDAWSFTYAEDGNLVKIEINDKALKDNSDTSSILIQLSSGKLIRNGTFTPQKNQVFDSEVFKSFFTDPLDMNIARQGELSMIDSTLIYIISDFKYKNNDIVIISHDQHFSLFRNYNQKWYKWERETSKIVIDSGYKWINGYRLYSGKNLDQEVLLMKDDLETPLIIFKGGVEIYVKLPNFTQLNDRQLGFVHFLPCHHLFDKHLTNFTDTGMLVLNEYKTIGDNVAHNLFYIFPGLRLKDDPHRQFILYETVDKKIELLNRPGWSVDPHQIVYDNTGMMGTLVVSNQDGQKFIFIPLIEKHNNEYLNFIEIEEIPINDGLPSPQTLQQRLLLAFTSIKAYEYKLARELLHPFTSITQNEPLSLMEFEIIKWIIMINGGGSETSALKLMAFMYLIIDQKKYPSIDRDKTAELIEKIVSSMTGQHVGNELVVQELRKTMKNYLLSIRDLPEKYYIYRLFTEFLDSNLIENFINTYAISVKKECDIDKNPTLTYQKTSYLDFRFHFGEVPPDIIFTSLLKLSSSNENEKKMVFEYIKLMSKLIIRQNRNGIEAGGHEMLIYCAAHMPDLFKNMSSLANDLINDKDVKKLFFDEFFRVIEICSEKYVDDFKPISLNYLSTVTPPNVLVGNFREDSKSRRYSDAVSSIKCEVTNPDDLKQFESLADALKQFSSKIDKLKSVEFEASALKKSKVLSKLETSILSYLESQKKVSQAAEHILESSKIIKLLKEKFVGYVSERIEILQKKLKDMAEQLTAMTENDNLNTISGVQIMERLNRLLHARKVKPFEALYACYQRQSVDCIHSKFTQLSLEDCTKLLHDTTAFYIHQVFLDYLIMLQGTVKRLTESKQISMDDLNLLLDELEKIKDFNTRLATPTILNFEFRSQKYRLRSEQVTDINNFIKKDELTGNYKSSVIQRMMAAGKTLVLGTISVVMKALDGTKLSILVPPSSLYQSNLSSMQARTYKFFKTKGTNFVFPRFKFNDVKHLRNFLNPFMDSLIKSMKKTMEFRDYLVLNPDILQSFLNSYAETLYTLAKGVDSLTMPHLHEALEKFATIYQLFRTKGSIILDEIDMTMDPKKELNFPTSENEPFNMNAVVLLTDLIEFSVFDEDVKKFSGLNILSNNQSSLTAANYEIYLHDHLLKYIHKQLETGGSIWNRTLLSKSSELLNVGNIMNFLGEEDTSNMKTWIQDLVKDQKDEIANVLIIIKVQIWNGIKDALKGEANLNYGSAGSNRPSVQYAVPYVAANTPSPSSEFADRWETMNKTLLMLASVTCSKSMAKQIITYIINNIVSEMNMNLKYFETVTYKNVSVLIPGVNPLKLDDSKSTDVNMVHESLKKRSPAAIRLLFSYAVDEIFSKMTFPVEQITSNALNMVSMFGSVQGYSGTIDNVNILPREVIADAYKNHLDNEKNNGGIALKLVRDSQNDVVPELNESDMRKSISEIMEKMIQSTFKTADEANELSALIDVGAFFKNFKNKLIAESILTLLKDRIKVVLYYDEVSNQVEFVQRAGEGKFKTGYISNTEADFIATATRVEVQERFTFYDQRHITGSDILQPKTGKALLTVGPRVLLRDILQGTLRMRQFMTSQTVHMVTNTATAQFYRSKIPGKLNKLRVTDLLALGSINEDEKQAGENLKLAFVKIDNEVRRFVLDELSSNRYTKANMTRNIRIWFKRENRILDLFIKTTREDPMSWMTKSIKKSSHKVFSKYANGWIKMLTKISSLLGECSFINDESFKTLVSNLQSLIMDSKNTDINDCKRVESVLSFLDKKINLKTNTVGGGMEVETRTTSHQLVDVNLELLIKETPSRKECRRSKYFTSENLISSIEDASISSMNDQNISSLDSILNDKNFSDALQKLAASATITNGLRVGVTTDLIFYSNLNKMERPFLIFTRETLEGSFILIQVLPEDKDIRAVLMSIEAADYFIAEMIEKLDFKGSTFWLCNLSGRVMISNDPETPIGANVMEFVKASRLLIFDLLIFNGSLDHILNSEYLKEIYINQWLKGPLAQNRAKFLLLRMTVLADKAKYIFASDNQDIFTLKRIASGNFDDIGSAKALTTRLYKKSAIEDDKEDSFFKVNKLTRQSFNDYSSSCTIADHSKVFQEILGTTMLPFDNTANITPMTSTKVSEPEVNLVPFSFSANKPKVLNLSYLESRWSKIADYPMDYRKEVDVDSEKNQSSPIDESFTDSEFSDDSYDSDDSEEEETRSETTTSTEESIGDTNSEKSIDYTNSEESIAGINNSICKNEEQKVSEKVNPDPENNTNNNIPSESGTDKRMDHDKNQKEDDIYSETESIIDKDNLKNEPESKKIVDSNVLVDTQSTIHIKDTDVVEGTDGNKNEDEPKIGQVNNSSVINGIQSITKTKYIADNHQNVDESEIEHVDDIVEHTNQKTNGPETEHVNVVSETNNNQNTATSLETDTVNVPNNNQNASASKETDTVNVQNNNQNVSTSLETNTVDVINNNQNTSGSQSIDLVQENNNNQQTNSHVMATTDPTKNKNISNQINSNISDLSPAKTGISKEELTETNNVKQKDVVDKSYDKNVSHNSKYYWIIIGVALILIIIGITLRLKMKSSD